jgi:hypothetical protein
VTPLIDNCPLIKRGRRLFFALIDDPCSVFMSCICLASIIGHLLNIQLRFWGYPVFFFFLKINIVSFIKDQEQSSYNTWQVPKYL